MVLHPLEFSECYIDSPWFRQSIKEYEYELESTNSQIKQLIKDAKNMLGASKKQGEMMRVFNERLQKFRFEIIGENLTDDERGIAGSLKEFGNMLEEIASEWNRTIERSEIQLIQPLETFRKDHIHSYREAKKLFDKSCERYYKQMETTLGLSHKKKEQQLLEADNELINQKKNYHKASLNYVYKLQEVQERKKFEFVEHLLMFMQVYFNFFHQTHETALDCKEYMTDIQMRLVSTRSQYEGTRAQTDMLMRKMMVNPSYQTDNDSGDSTGSPNRVVGQRWARAGYLMLLEKNTLGSRFTSKWTRYFCMYTKANKLFQMLPPYSSHQSSSSSATQSTFIGVEPMIVLSCVRKMTESIDKRFCFDIDVEDSATGKQSSLTLQALSNSDRKKWIQVMDGKEPNYITSMEYKKPEEFRVNETSVKFVENVIAEIERRGVEAEGIYRLVGVSSKVDKILQIVMDPEKASTLNYQDEIEWELNTLTSALKSFFRNLPEPIMTFDMHEDFILAAKQQNPEERLKRVVNLVGKLPSESQRILKMLIIHLQKVAARSVENKMIVQNIGVCFGPTLMRPKQETVQSIMEIKFNNIIVEILIENYSAIFGEEPDGEEESKPHAKSTVGRLPSRRFKSKQKNAHGIPSIEAVDEQGDDNSQTGLPESNSKFARGHAIRGSPSRTISPRSLLKPDDGNLSSDTNTDEFGRISPLDLNLDMKLDHFSLPTPEEGKLSPGYATIQKKSQQAEPMSHDRESQKAQNSDQTTRGGTTGKPSATERSKSLTERNRSSLNEAYSSVRPNNSQNRNQNNCNAEAAAPTLLQRKERLLVSMRQNERALKPLPHKNKIKRGEASVRERPDHYSNPGSPPNCSSESNLDIEKLKERFFKNVEDRRGDPGSTRGSSLKAESPHTPSFLWPKAGSFKANSVMIEGDAPELRPRSTVVSLRSATSRTCDHDFPVYDVIGDDADKGYAGKMYQTLFACEAEHNTELSFEAGMIIRNVRPSEEPGWLEGELDGVSGLIPENYVRVIES